MPPPLGAPSPRGANMATAGVLVGFVVGVFFYCTRAVGSQNQISSEEIDEFKVRQQHAQTLFQLIYFLVS